MAKEREKPEERKRAEEALQRLKDINESIVQSMGEGIVVEDRQGYITFVNPAAATLLGYDAEELVGQHWTAVIPPDQHPTVKASDERRARGESDRYELDLVRKDDIRVPVLASGSPRFEGGRFAGTLTVFTDITERKRAEETLQRLKDFNESIVQNMGEGIVVEDRQGYITFVNPTAAALLGYDAEELTGQHWTVIVPPDQQPIVQAADERRARGESDRYELELMGKNGTRVPVLVSGSPRFEGGRFAGTLAVFTDITERKRAEEEIRRLSQFLDSAIDNANVWLDVLDEKANVVIWNRAAEEISGYSREEVVGHGKIWEWLYPDEEYRHEITAKAATIIEGAEMVEDFETTIQRKDGQTRIISWNSRNLLGEKGTPIGSIALGRDITERKRAEEEIRRRSDELATLNAIAMTVTSTLDPQEVLQAIQERVMELLDEPYPPLFFLFNEEHQTFKATPTRLQEQGLRRVEKLIGTNLEEFPCPLAALKPALREALLAGKPYVTDDLSDLCELGISRELLKDAQSALEIKSIVGLPLWVKGKLVGIVLLVSPKEKMPEEEIELLSAIASQAAIAIENTLLYEEARRKADELAALYDISLDVVAQLDLEKLLQTIIERATRLLNARGGGIYLYDPAKREIELRVSFGPFSKDYTGTRLALGEGLSGKVAQSGEPLVVEDYAHWEGRSPQYDEEPSINVLGVPLKRGDELLGVLFINHEVEKSFHEADIRLATLFANQAAIAIENARLYEQTDGKLQDRVAELTALNAIAASLTSSLKLDEILESMTTRVAQMMQARICTIRLMEGNELTIGAATGYRDESSRQHTIKIDKRLARIVQDQKPLMVEDLWEAEDISPSRRMRAWREEVHSFLGVPMISKGKTIGVLSIYGERPHHFAQEEVRLLCTIAKQAAIAIESARLYERVREHAGELEGLVQERTKELQAIHAELLQSAKLAALGQLAAGVAHELNNPLGAISGYLELLQEGVALGPQEMDYMERIEKRIQQATKIVGELRSVGIPSEPVWQIVDVSDILEEILTLVERRLSLHQIKVQKDMTPDMPLVDGDPDRLQQVFINIITNARQAMKEGGTLKVTSRESRNGEWVEIIFADTGEGIAKEHLNKIFDPFFTTRSPGKGMGLGLSISHRHIKDHGGAINVWSEKGRGTVFRVALPPSGAKRCWEILDCDEKERCKAVRENAEYKCWSVMEDVSRCEGCEVYRRKALPPLDGSLLPQ